MKQHKAVEGETTFCHSCGNRMSISEIFCDSCGLKQPMANLEAVEVEKHQNAKEVESNLELPQVSCLHCGERRSAQDYFCSNCGHTEIKGWIYSFKTE